MTVRVPVAADAREWPSGVPESLASLGARVRRERLAVGDYDVGGGILVERKSVRDLHLTIVTGRYWSQIGRLRRGSRWPVLLIEGYRLDRGPVDGAAIRGACLATSEQGVVVLRSNDTAESAAWLLRLAVRAQGVARRDRPRFAQIPKSPTRNDVPAAMLAAVPGISTVTAGALLRAFGSVSAVVNTGPDEWGEVRGFGPHRIRALWEALHGTPPP